MRVSARTAATCASATNAATSRSCRFVTGPGRSGSSRPSSSTLDIGTLDAVAGVVAIAIERAQFLARARGRRARAAEGGSRGDAARVAQSRSEDAVDRDPGGGREPARRPAARGPARAGATRPSPSWIASTRLFQDILDMARIDAAAIRVDRQWVTAADVVDAAVRTSGTHSTDMRCASTPTRRRRSRSIRGSRRSPCRTFSRTRRAIRPPIARSSWMHASDARRAARRRSPITGPGLDPGELDHLFERFYRGRAARQTAPGTGMGLSITRGLLAALGGRVWAENVPGAGARFSMVDSRRRTRDRDGWHSDASANSHRRRRAEHSRPRVAPLLRARGYDVLSGDERPRRARDRRARQARPDRARPRPAGHRRRRGVPAGARQISNVPIVVLSARGAEGDKVARARRRRRRLRHEAVRRRGAAGAHSRGAAALGQRRRRRSEPIVRGDLVIDRERFRVLRDGEEVRLTPKEFELLTYLAQHPGRVLTHRTILKAIWGPQRGRSARASARAGRCAAQEDRAEPVDAAIHPDRTLGRLPLRGPVTPHEAPGHTRPVATSTRSMALMPTNGSTTPPTP